MTVVEKTSIYMSLGETFKAFHMRPIDLLTEQLARDARTDSQAGKSLFQESLKLAMMGGGTTQLTEKEIRQLKQELAGAKDGGERDKMTLASIAFCSPLMLLGVGAALAFVDDMRGSRVGKIESALANRVNLRQQVMNAAVSENMRKEKDKTKNLSTAMEPLPVTPRPARPEEKSESAEKKKTMLSAVESDRVARQNQRPRKPQKDWITVEKAMKEKQELVDYMETMRGKLSVKSAANLSARIEQLDKVLKKMAAVQK